MRWKVRGNYDPLLVISISIVFLANPYFPISVLAQTSEQGKAIFNNNYTITNIANATDFIPIEWSHKDSNIVFGRNSTHFVKLDLQTGNRDSFFSTIGSHNLFPTNQSIMFDPVYPYSVSYSDNQLLFSARAFIDGVERYEIFRYDILTSHLSLLSNNVMNKSNTMEWALWMPNDKMLLMEEERDSTGEIHKTYHLWVTNSNGQKEKLLLEKEDMVVPKVSKDGKKIMYFVIEQSITMGYPKSHIEILDINSQKLSLVPYSTDGCLNYRPEMSPNNQLILYQSHSCARAPGGSIEVVSVTGTFFERIISYEHAAPSDPVLSPDGRYMLFNLEYSSDFRFPSGLFLVEFAHPMPEFDSIATFVMAVAIVGVVVTFRGFVK